MRLDLADAAYEDRGGYAALVPGDAHRSELLDRVLADEPGELMPPADSGKQLTAEQIDMLRAWIEEGAEYQQHWAFAAPKESVLTSVQNSEWPHNAIDTFVLSRLEEQGMTPAPEADRYQLVRRVYLDLIGLPPTIQEADEFVSDARPDAYERLVDRLLASPHYGERWARRWLDLARYSDTKGYEKDQPRTMWLYRDWVIKALNDDMPFDQFTIEQIAGDMLPEATLEQRIATGFHRNTMTNEEGGIDPQEFRYHAIVDRVATTGTTWLGLTLGCAQCHTHKFDPITHTEYFQVFAFLNNADELKISVPQPKVAEERREIEAELEATLVDLERRFPFESRLGDKDREEKEQAIASSFQQWSMEHSSRLAFWTPLRPQQVQSNLPITTVLEDHSILASGDVTKNDTFELTFKVGPKPITAIRLEALPHSSLPGGGPGRQIIVSGDQKEGNFYLSEVDAWVTTTSHTSAEPTPIEFEKATASFVPPGLDADRAIDGQPDTGWTIAKQEGNRHAIVLHLAKPLQLSKHERLKVRLQHEFFYPAGLGRFRISTTSAPNEVKPSDLPEEVVLALIIPEEKRTSHQQRRLYREYLLQTPEFQSEQAQVEKLEARLPSYPTALVMSERSEQHRRQTARHHRGEYLQPKEQVQPGGLAALHAFPKAAKLDRLAFAKWLISPENPLVARVVVNRQWEAIFGRGLVRTSEDFGTQSEFPTHPKLLDWLAVEFMERGWSLKHIHKLIVMSATYRQSSLTDDNKRSHDPENKLLSRGPRLRVESELVRDIVLKSSGLLSSKIGGPSVFPPQPPGITEAAYGALQWKVSLGEDPYRRGLYTFNKRTAPYAAFGIFDAPSGEVCVPRRDRSNTPLQSLALLNDEVVLEAARSMASSE
ncbi:MAG: PSD1 and planctomycete cytochrome C domain-containing protein, partial [Lacipirellulaceae bacterium]